jgi:tRNA A37 methylthiotransferase MiaB
MTSEQPTYSVITFGCRVNQADSFSIARDLRARGAVEASPGQADIVVVNTCSVTTSADQGAGSGARPVGAGGSRESWGSARSCCSSPS